MNDKNATPISQLGEFGLIRHLTQDIKLTNSTSYRGVGDDCAVIEPQSGYRQLVTTDILMEGIHFDLSYTPLKHLGYKAAVVNISDVCAMMGLPQQLLVSLAVDKRFSVEDVDQIYSGIRLACDRYGVDLVGGDTSSSLTGLVISPTCIGQTQADKIVYRSGARDTDLICVSGNLGAAYMGLQLLEREKHVYDQQVHKGVSSVTAQPDFSGHEYILERQLKPEARLDIVHRLKKADIQPTSMMDISDGLSSELLHICKQSQTGCLIYEDRIPIDLQTAAMAEQFNISPTTCALNGGEDYELLFTVSLADYDKVKQLEDIRIIGRIQKAQYGCELETSSGQDFPLEAQGWQAMSETPDKSS